MNSPSIHYCSDRRSTKMLISIGFKSKSVKYNICFLTKHALYCRCTTKHGYTYDLDNNIRQLTMLLRSLISHLFTLEVASLCNYLHHFSHCFYFHFVCYIAGSWNLCIFHDLLHSSTLINAKR